MKRFVFAAGVTVFLAAAFTGAGLAKTDGAARHAVISKAKLPPLPSYVKSRHHWVIGIKCDFPPFGYIDYTGNSRGYDVSIARRFPTISFGRPNPVRLVCRTTPSRIPTLQSRRVDLIISTLTWTTARPL